MTQHTISMLSLRKAPGEVFDRVRYTGDSFLVKRNKKVIGVIQSPDENQEYQSLLKDKVSSLEDSLKINEFITHKEFDFMKKHAGYSESQRDACCSTNRVLNEDTIQAMEETGLQSFNTPEELFKDLGI